MNELERIVRETRALADAYLLATVVRVSGSSYRRPGARMLVAGERWVSGCVSGGCLEGDVMMRGAHRTKDGAVVVTYDSTRDGDEPWGVGLGCNGIVVVLLERVEPGTCNDALGFAAACFAAETAGTLVTVIKSARPGIAVGARIARGPACTLVHTVTDPDVRLALESAARGPAGVIELDGISALVETIAPSPQLFVLGSGHDAAPLVTLAQSIGFRVTVADRAIRERSRILAADRALATGGDLVRVRELIDTAAEPYVVIMHHHNDTDRDALAMTLASRAHYIGVLGPARRTHELLAETDCSVNDPRLHAPVGLDIGAENPPEQIALAIVAEIQAVRSRARGGMLRARARALHADLATIVLAAGGSRRLGHPKQLVELAGRPLVQQVAATCIASAVGPVGVVLGSSAAAVADALGSLRVAHIVNDHWEQGIASSIRAGVRWAQTTNAGALLIVLADQPLLDVAHISALRDAWLAGAPIVASRFDGLAAAPAVFDRSQWPALSQLEGDQGAGRLLRTDGIVAVEWAHGALDVDTAEDMRILETMHETATG